MLKLLKRFFRGHDPHAAFDVDDLPEVKQRRLMRAELDLKTRQLSSELSEAIGGIKPIAGGFFLKDNP